MNMELVLYKSYLRAKYIYVFIYVFKYRKFYKRLRIKKGIKKRGARINKRLLVLDLKKKKIYLRRFFKRVIRSKRKSL